MPSRHSTSAPERRRRALLLSLGPLCTIGLQGCAARSAGSAAQPPAALAPETAVGPFTALLSGAHRSPRNTARDAARHPDAVLAFFGVRPDSRVVEILPGSGGYYMEILAPYLRARGQYIAANRDASAPPAYLADHQRLLERLRAQPDLYGAVEVTPFNADLHAIAPAGSADFVLTFRNLHNWMERNELSASLRAFHRALKPGGVLGVVDHRGRTDQSQQAQMHNGYVREDVAIALIEQAGFQLAGRSEVNANPRDTKDHPEGVWTLPP
ncbi:MAG TPA: methyltransferase domain-containing protein, partial [Burkholderiaceae bacterium]|nr:methyltransferase domain-containing protein [Burkholderiaceae bacterium]